MLRGDFFFVGFVVMRLSPSSSSRSLERKDIGRSSSRNRKKHKKLDAICEEEYNRNHGDSNDGDGDLNPDSGVRRSSRVRRAPVLLDVSSPPRKKQRKSGKDVTPRGIESVENLGRENGGSGGGNWSLRSRSRGRNEKLEEKELPRGKRKLFDEELEVDRKEELEGSTPKKTVKSKKRPGKTNSTKHGEEHKENECQGSLDESKCQEVEPVLNIGEESAPVPETESPGGNPIDLRDGNTTPVIGNEERIVSGNLQPEECNGSVEPSPVEQRVGSVDDQDDQLESVKEGKDASGVAEIAEISTKEVENEGSIDKEAGVDENVSKDENIEKMDELKQASNDKPGYQYIKEGRRCGLCGRGSDGKPPKRLIQDNGESENEAYSGSSASEEPTYDIWDGFDDEPGWLGRLLGPINDRYGIAGIWVHQQCAVWSPEV